MPCLIDDGNLMKQRSAFSIDDEKRSISHGRVDRPELGAA
jgi:hypothetical protein